MYLQKGDDIIMLVMLKFGQNLVKVLYPLNLENEIFTGSIETVDI